SVRDSPTILDARSLASVPTSPRSSAEAAIRSALSCWRPEEQALVLGLGAGPGLVDDLLTIGAGLLTDGGGLLAGGRELLLLIALELVDLLLDLLRIAQTTLDLLRALVQHGVQPRQDEPHEDDREDHQEDERPDDLRRQGDQEAPARD